MINEDHTQTGDTACGTARDRELAYEQAASVLADDVGRWICRHDLTDDPDGETLAADWLAFRDAEDRRGVRRPATHPQRGVA